MCVCICVVRDEKWILQESRINETKQKICSKRCMKIANDTSQVPSACVERYIKYNAMYDEIRLTDVIAIR